MKIAIITDQHFGARKNSKLFHDYFLKFYEDVFFPTLEKEGITTIVDMGDTFDSRKGIDFAALSWAKNNYFDRLKKMGITVHTIVGNHTAYYKNTNNIIWLPIPFCMDRCLHITIVLWYGITTF